MLKNKPKENAIYKSSDIRYNGIIKYRTVNIPISYVILIQINANFSLHYQQTIFQRL